MLPSRPCKDQHWCRLGLQINEPWDLGECWGHVEAYQYFVNEISNHRQKSCCLLLPAFPSSSLPGSHKIRLLLTCELLFRKCCSCFPLPSHFLWPGKLQGCVLGKPGGRKVVAANGRCVLLCAFTIAVVQRETPGYIKQASASHNSWSPGARASCSQSACCTSCPILKDHEEEER